MEGQLADLQPIDEVDWQGWRPPIGDQEGNIGVRGQAFSGCHSPVRPYLEGWSPAVFNDMSGGYPATLTGNGEGRTGAYLHDTIRCINHKSRIKRSEWSQ